MAAIKEWFGLYNIIYEWFEKKYGYLELEEYWKHIARTCYSELAAEFREKGPEFVRQYFEEIFEKDGGKAAGTVHKDRVTIEVLDSPDVKWMNAFDNPAFRTVPYYFNHYEVIFGEIAQMADLDFKMLAIHKNGRCKWTFFKEGWGVRPQ